MRIKFLPVWLLALIAASLMASPVKALAYNRSAAAQYADQWWNSNNPQFYSFSNDDCTNFVSQALGAGGEQLANLNYMPQDDRAWYMYFNLSWIWSNSWSISGDNWQFMYGSGRAVQIGSYSGAAYTTNHSGAYAGDVLYYSWYYHRNPNPDTSINHAVMQVQDNYDEKGNWTSVVDSHSNSEYHKNWTLKTENPKASTTQIYVTTVIN